MTGYEEKKKRLKEQVQIYAKEKCMVAFSGGVDSSLLLKLVCEANARRAEDKGNEAPFHKEVFAVTMQTQLHPACEMEHAAKTAEEIGAVHLVIPADELTEAGIGHNPPDRCYRCKKYLFSKMKEKAVALGVRTVLEGTNEDDLHVYRPGLKAIRELGIISPLADAGFTKAEVRALAAEYGMSVSSRPAVPCLATRFPYGAELSYEALRKVEQGEEFLKSLGLYNVRLRIHQETARIEIDPEEFPVLLKNREQVVSCIRNLGYQYVTMDLEGFRSGSMDAGVENQFLSRGGAQPREQQVL